MFVRSWVLLICCLVCGARPAFAQGSSDWLSNVDVFVGLEGSKQPQDLGINANMGPRFAVNVGVPFAAAGLGVQVGVATNLSDAAVHVLDQVEGTSRRTQVFTTVGVFQRASRLSWAVGVDTVKQDYYDNVWMAQVRGEAGVSVSRSDQLGVWFTAPLRGTDAAVAETALRLDPIGQVNVTARHTWATGARTGIWVGVARGHHNVVLVFPDNSRDNNVVVYGADLWMPLNDRWAVTGATNLITPTATGTVDAYMGLAFNLGRRGAPSSTAPRMTVANNTSFAVDLARR